MAINHTYNHTIKNDAGAAVVADTLLITGDAEENFSLAVANGAVGNVVAAIVVANVLSFFIESDQNVTMKLNSTGSPAAPSPVSLVAKRAYWWHNLLPNTNPLTVNITQFYFDNTAGTKVANVRGGFLLQE
jgi:hypothetical protein